MARVDLSATDNPDEKDVPEPSSRTPKPPVAPPVDPPAKPTVKAEPVPRGQVAGKEKLQPYITVEVAEAARNAVVATTPYEGGYQSLSDLIEDAIREKLTRLERKFNNGDPFPARPRRKIRTGRPPAR